MLPVLEEKIQYKFTNPKLLEEALTHPSVKRLSKTNFSYQRLEFLGDKVLGLLVCDFLLAKYPNEEEGAISKRHAKIVCRASLCEIAKDINLGSYIILTKNQAVDGGRNSESILENVLEALIGAIYKDGGIEEARDFVTKFFSDLLLNTGKNPPQDPKSAFQEYFQKKYKKLPEYKITILEPGVFEATLEFNKKLIKANGKSIKEAEKLTAKIALTEIAK